MAVSSSGVGRRSAGAASEGLSARQPHRSVGVFAAGVAVVALVALVSGCGGDKGERLTTPAQAVTSGPPSGADSQTPTPTASTSATTTASGSTSSGPSRPTGTGITSFETNADGTVETYIGSPYSAAKQAEAVEFVRSYYAALNSAYRNPKDGVVKIRSMTTGSCGFCRTIIKDLEGLAKDGKRINGDHIKITSIRSDFIGKRTTVISRFNESGLPIVDGRGNKVGTAGDSQNLYISVHLVDKSGHWKVNGMQKYGGPR